MKNVYLFFGDLFVFKVQIPYKENFMAFPDRNTNRPISVISLPIMP